MKILFICRANAIRSQIAEAYYNKLTQTVGATSAGVDLNNSAIGDSPNILPVVVEAMKLEGIDLTSARRRWLTKEMVDAADTVVLLTDAPVPDYVHKARKLISWLDIPDLPKATPQEMFERVCRPIKTHVQKLIG